MSDSNSSVAVSVSEVVYLETAGQVLRALIFCPKGKGPFPALVCVHGGAWVSGDRFAAAGLAQRVAEKGIVVMAIDTRLAPACPYPDAVADVNFATRWLKYYGEHFDIDPDRVGGLGVSSGGQLLALSAMRFDDPRYTIHPLDIPDMAHVSHAAQQPDARMEFVITCSGVLDSLRRYKMAEAAGNRDIMMCHHACFGDEKTMAESCPLSILRRGENADLPEALFFQGGADPRLPADTANNMAESWNKAGGKATAIVYRGAEHSVGSWNVRDFSDMLDRISLLCHRPFNVT